jgi:hypothetical protein
MARHETEMHRAKRVLEDENVQLRLALKEARRLCVANQGDDDDRWTTHVLATIDAALQGPQQPCDVGLFGERQSDLTDKL